MWHIKVLNNYQAKIKCITDCCRRKEIKLV